MDPQGLLQQSGKYSPGDLSTVRQKMLKIKLSPIKLQGNTWDSFTLLSKVLCGALH